MVVRLVLCFRLPFLSDSSSAIVFGSGWVFGRCLAWCWLRLVSCLPLPLIFVCFALAFGFCFGSGLSAGVSFGFSFAFASPWGFDYASTFGFGSSSRFGVGLAFASLFAFLAVFALTLPLLCGLVFWLWDWI